MNEKRIIVINPATSININSDSPELSKKRVCAYARVSTDFEDQLNSYNAQIKEYTKRINENSNWEFKGMYADEGITGTSMKKRPEFLKMLDEARQGNIDLILTKSLSRFARNTVECLTIIREMREINVEIYFEKENLYSSDPKVDFLLTIFSSIAQEEARNISENIKWGKRKRYQEGKVYINTSRFLGYDKDENGKIVINEKEAEVVKMIFNLYLSGLSPREIAEHLTNNNIKNGRGVVFWKPATVMNILTNEKYCGDALLQKRVTVDYLTQKSVVNNGQAPKYYIMNNHEAIIPREMFELTQQLKAKRGNNENRSHYGNRYPMSGIVYCGSCHRVLNRHYFNYGSKYQRVVMSCKNTSKGKVKCDRTPIDNDTLEKAACDAINKFTKSNPEIINEILNCVKDNLSLNESYLKISAIENNIIKLEQEISELINLRITSDINSNDEYFKKEYDEKKLLIKSYKKELSKYQKEMADNHIKEERINKLREFIQTKSHILSRDALISIFPKIIVLSDNSVIFCIFSKNISKDLFINNINKFIDYTPIIKDTFINEESNRKVSYSIIEIGDEVYEY